jgi:hypothetical protein
MGELMKKVLIILTAMLFLVVAVGAAYAAETTFNGQYTIRAWSNWNFDKRPDHFDSERGLYTGYFDQRFRLTITHKTSEFLKAVVQIDLVEDTWGQQRNFRINNSTSGAFVRWAYVEFNVPKIGTFTVGKQPVVLGYGLMLSNTTNAFDGLKWSNKWGPVAVSAMYFKYNDNVRLGSADPDYNSDADLWALDLKYTPNANHTIELFGGYYENLLGSTFSHSESFDADDHTRIGFVGLAYTGEIANMLTLKAEFSGLFGKELLDKEYIRGYNIYLDASYHNDMLRAGVAFVLGSGNSPSNHYDDDMNFIAADTFSFGNIIGGGCTKNGLNDTWAKGLGFANDIENLTAVKLYFEVTPMEKLSLSAAVIWAKWTEPVGSDAGYWHPVDYYVDKDPYTPWYDKSTDLGWEIDLGAKYQIMEGLSYTLSAGVLFPGKSFDYVGENGTSHEKWGPIWMLNNNLTYEF